MGLTNKLSSRLIRMAQVNPSLRQALRPFLIDRRSLELCMQEQEDEAFITFHERPKSAGVIGTWSDRVRQRCHACIVVQGPLMKENEFTLESVKLYKKHFPSTQIIVSTWDDEDRERIKAIEAAGALAVLNKKPENPGPANVNMQIISSKAGVLKAKGLGAEYIIKSRTDQRFFAPNVIEFLSEVHAMFPPKQGFRQEGRIIGVSLDTFKYRPYGISDMFTFGLADDMVRYWSPDLDQRKRDCENLNQSEWNIVEFARFKFGEVYFAAEYLSSIGRELKWTLEDSWRAYADHFVIVDKESIDLYWNKYNRSKENRYLRYDNIRTDQELTFREWLLLNRSQVNKINIPEAALQRSFGESIDASGEKR